MADEETTAESEEGEEMADARDDEPEDGASHCNLLSNAAVKAQEPRTDEPTTSRGIVVEGCIAVTHAVAHSATYVASKLGRKVTITDHRVPATSAATVSEAPIDYSGSMSKTNEELTGRRG